MTNDIFGKLATCENTALLSELWIVACCGKDVSISATMTFSSQYIAGKNKSTNFAFDLRVNNSRAKKAKSPFLNYDDISELLHLGGMKKTLNIYLRFFVSDYVSCKAHAILIGVNWKSKEVGGQTLCKHDFNRVHLEQWYCFCHSHTR